MGLSAIEPPTACKTARPDMPQTKYAPQYHLRALSDASLYDLLAFDPDKHAKNVRELLSQRGISPEVVEREINRRKKDSNPRSCARSSLYRRLIVLFTLIVAWFNAKGFLQLYATDSSYKTFLIIFVVMTIAFGFYLGLKFNMYLYLGDPQRVYCGFPIAVGFVDAASGEEKLPPKPRFFLSLLANGLVSVNFTLFIPMLAVYILG
jgi:hypothetical protein